MTNTRNWREETPQHREWLRQVLREAYNRAYSQATKCETLNKEAFILGYVEGIACFSFIAGSLEQP